VSFCVTLWLPHLGHTAWAWRSSMWHVTSKSVWHLSQMNSYLAMTPPSTAETEPSLLSYPAADRPHTVPPPTSRRAARHPTFEEVPLAGGLETLPIGEHDRPRLQALEAVYAGASLLIRLRVQQPTGGRRRAAAQEGAPTVRRAPAPTKGNAMRLHRYAGPALLTALLAAIVLVVVTAAPQQASAATKRVTIANFTFTPQTITVKHGAKVVWKNADSTAHNVTSASGMSTSATVTALFASPTLGPGQSWSHVFKKRGTYYYECTFHAGMATMHGKIVVK
jgi:plastocyanin